MGSSETDAGRQIEAWVHRLTAAGWSPLVLLLLEGVRALGPMLGQAVVLGEPLLEGLVDRRFLSEVSEWLMDGRSIDRLLARLEESPAERESC
ncbi:MAG TPA: hypothetical protein G4O00_05600 [Thermoflexia bacterium]|nr:hypothetical protein [Thermoflexia bacterium]